MFYKQISAIIMLLFIGFSAECQKSVYSKKTNLINHVVVCWLKDSDEVQKAKIIEESQVLKNIPGIIDFKVGPVVESQRNIVDDSFDIALLMSFKSKSEMDTYIKHPTHQNFVKEKLKPNLKKVVVYDFEN